MARTKWFREEHIATIYISSDTRMPRISPVKSISASSHFGRSLRSTGPILVAGNRTLSIWQLAPIHRSRFWRGALQNPLDFARRNEYSVMKKEKKRKRTYAMGKRKRVRLYISKNDTRSETVESTNNETTVAKETRLS